MNWHEDLTPRAVWEHFYQLTQIPRPSHHEERISAFLAGFGQELGLDTEVDEVGDVLIRKPASAGMEDRPGVILQAHMDMVPEKAPGKVHDFETDPITALVADGWLRTDGTTLGADDGIGVALIMTLLQDETIVHGPLEALFTVNEEDGFTGADARETRCPAGIAADQRRFGSGRDLHHRQCRRRRRRRDGKLCGGADARGADRPAPRDHGAARRSFGHRHRPRPRQRHQAAGSPALERAAGDRLCAWPRSRLGAGTTPSRGRPRRWWPFPSPRRPRLTEYSRRSPQRSSRNWPGPNRISRSP